MASPERSESEGVVVREPVEATVTRAEQAAGSLGMVCNNSLGL